MGLTGIGVWALVAIVLINTVFIAGMAVALWLIHQKIETALAKIEPLVQQGAKTLSQVSETTARLQTTVDTLVEKSTQLVDNVADRVDRTSATAEEVVGEPLIGAASVVAGMHRALQVYAERSQEANGK